MTEISATEGQRTKENLFFGISNISASWDDDGHRLTLNRFQLRAREQGSWKWVSDTWLVARSEVECPCLFPHQGTLPQESIALIFLEVTGDTVLFGLPLVPENAPAFYGLEIVREPEGLRSNLWWGRILGSEHLSGEGVTEPEHLGVNRSIP